MDQGVLAAIAQENSPAEEQQIHSKVTCLLSEFLLQLSSLHIILFSEIKRVLSAKERAILIRIPLNGVYSLG